MINLEVLLTADPAKLALMMCYLSYDCTNCPICKREGPDPSLEQCHRKLYSWLMSRKDKEFWRNME